MNLNKVIKEIEHLNCKVIILKDLSTKGRYVLAKISILFFFVPIHQKSKK